jgi:hypothetical protein
VVVVGRLFLDAGLHFVQVSAEGLAAVPGSPRGVKLLRTLCGRIGPHSSKTAG